MKATDRLYGMNWVGQLQYAFEHHTHTVRHPTIEHKSMFLRTADAFLLEAYFEETPEGITVWSRRFMHLRQRHNELIS